MLTIDGVQCQHAKCTANAEPGMKFCQYHLEGLQFLVAQLEIRCSRCEAWAPRGLLNHDCTNPDPQPPPDEL